MEIFGTELGTTMRFAVALIIAAICEIAGALITGGNVVETISSGIINIETIPDRTVFSWAMLSALLAAGLLVTAGCCTKKPAPAPAPEVKVEPTPTPVPVPVEEPIAAPVAKAQRCSP